MILIGLCGAANSGKDTVSEMLPYTASIAFADPLYSALSMILDVSVTTLKDRDFKETAIPWIGKSPREMLQSLGTEWGRGMVCSDLWMQIARRRIESGGEFVVIRDVRFDNEAEMIRSMGGEVWRISRPGASTCVPHGSEVGVSDSLVDRNIVNNGTMRELADAVRTACVNLVRKCKIEGSAA